MSTIAQVTGELAERIGADKLITDPQRRQTYECDGLAQYAVVPGLVVLARSADDIAATVRELVNRIGPDARICVLPEGPLTVPYVAVPAL